MSKKIEIFTGSKKALEDMTGRQYEAMKTDEGLLLQLSTRNSNKYGDTYQREACEGVLAHEAQIVGADAVVHVTYVPYTDQSTLKDHNSMILINAFGYAVKIVE